ncbi:hypothetical protein AK830_g2745 [Neonectria ditissima]|uniref:Uncharacterized protein n=1 Tax=Neonectria ditissima TaxID=78410 RepID=A0A0P7BQV9_9HYPO|nr:hypothetical protein AK830_g2745 [Neonectria ditissima]
MLRPIRQDVEDLQFEPGYLPPLHDTQSKPATTGHEMNLPSISPEQQKSSIPPTPIYDDPTPPPLPADMPDSVHQPTSVRARKSRFTTLPTNVDSAIRILYSELETTSMLREKVSDLESQLSHQRKELSLRQKELEFARKIAEKAQVSDDEIARLRAEASGKQAAVKEAETLRVEKRGLEMELDHSRKELGSVSKTLQDLRRKLSVLIGE